MISLKDAPSVRKLTLNSVLAGFVCACFLACAKPVPLKAQDSNGAAVPMTEKVTVLKVTVDGRRYLVDTQGGVTDPVTGRDVVNDSVIRKARYASSIAFQRILTVRAAAGNRFSPEKARYLRATALVKPSWKGMAAVLFQDRRLFEGVIRDGGPVPEPIVDFLVSRVGRRGALSVVRYMVEYPLSAIILAAGDAFKGAVDAYCENLAIYERVRQNSSITYDEARKFLANESFKEYLPLVTRLMDDLDLALDKGLLQEASEIEERAFSADFAAFTPFAMDAGPISVLEREMWNWDQWRSRPLLWNPLGMDWWSLSSDRNYELKDSGLRLTRKGARIARRESRYGTVNRRLARSRDVWDAYRWTWDAVDWLSWRTRRWRLLSLRTWLLREHREMILERIQAMDKMDDLFTMKDAPFLARFEPILRETLRRLGAIQAYREFMTDRLRVTATYSKIGAQYLSAMSGRMDPSSTPSTWWGGMDPFRDSELFGREQEVLKVLQSLPAEQRENLLDLAQNYSSVYDRAVQYIAGLKVHIPAWLPGNPAQQSYSELVERDPPTKSFDGDKRVLNEWIYPQDMNWADAAARGLVTAQIQPGGSLLSENTVTILFKLRGRQALHVFLPAGTLIRSESSFAQDLIVRAPGDVVDEGFEEGYLITLEPDTLPLARVAVAAFATDPVLPMPNPATPMTLSAAAPMGKAAAIVRTHSIYRLNSNRTARLMSLYPDLAPFMKKVSGEMISSAPFLTLACQFAIWAETRGLRQGNLQTSMESILDNDGRVMTLSRVRAQAQAMGGCVRAILRESGFATDFMTQGRNFPDPAALKWPRGDYFRGRDAIKASEYSRGLSILGKLLTEMTAQTGNNGSPRGSLIDVLEVKTLMTRAILSSPEPDFNVALELFKDIREEELVEVFPLGAMCLGAVRSLSGDNSSALELLSRVAASMGDRIPEIHYHLGRALAGAGREREAISSFAAFLEAPRSGPHSPFTGPMSLTGRARTWMILLGALLSKGAN